MPCALCAGYFLYVLGLTELAIFFVRTSDLVIGVLVVHLLQNHRSSSNIIQFCKSLGVGVYSCDMDLNKIPKQFCENVSIGVTPEFFIMAMLSGGNAMTYALTPQHAKRLAQSLAYNVQEFENRFGEIKAEWKPGLESPMQMLDIKGGDKKQ